MSEQYIRILKESLCRKIELLKELQRYSELQTESAKAEEANWDLFDEAIEKKALLIEELNRLDEGFELIFQRVKELLDSDKEKYQTDILFLKKCVSEITSLSTSLEALERRNKKLIEERFSKQRKEYGQKSVSARAAASYYQSASRLNFVDPQLMDQKK